MKLKYAGLMVATLVGGISPALGEPSAPEASGDQVSLSYLLASNLEQYSDCRELEPLDFKVRAEIDRLPSIGVLDTIDAMDRLSHESPCGNLKQYALEAHELAFSDRQLFLVKMGLTGPGADDEDEQEPEGKGQYSGFSPDGPPPLSAGKSPTSDYQQ